MKRFITAFVSAWLLLAGWGAAPALTPMERSFDELVALSEVVLVGTVAQTVSSWDESRTRIYTYVTLSDLEVIKGEVSGPDYTLRVRGGVVGDQAELIAGMPNLQTGNRYLLFIRGNFQDIFPVVGIQQGVFQIQRDAQSQREIVLDHQKKPVVGVTASELRTGAAQQAPAPEAMTKDEFVNLIRRRLQTPPGGGSPPAPPAPGPEPK